MGCCMEIVPFVVRASSYARIRRGRSQMQRTSGPMTIGRLDEAGDRTRLGGETRTAIPATTLACARSFTLSCDREWTHPRGMPPQHSSNGFRVLLLETIRAHTDRANAASQRVLLACGLRRSGAIDPLRVGQITWVAQVVPVMLCPGVGGSTSEAPRKGERLDSMARSGFKPLQGSFETASQATSTPRH
jgi:hypothetical protein